MQDLENVFNKFGFDYEKGQVEGMGDFVVNRIVVNGTSYPLFNGYSLANVTVSASTNPEDNGNVEEKKSSYDRFGVQIERNDYEDPFTDIPLRIVVLPISKLNLVTKSYSEKDLVVITEEDGWLVISNNN